MSRQLVEAMTGSSLMLPEHRLYPWDTVVCCGSRLARTPVSRTLRINLVHAQRHADPGEYKDHSAQVHPYREAQERLSLRLFSAHPQ